MKLTKGQEEAKLAINKFLMDPSKSHYVLEGFSGCGKSYLVRKIIEELPETFKTIELLNIDIPQYQLALTTTTHKAAAAFETLTNASVGTIHALLGLRVNYDYRTGESSITAKSNSKAENTIIFIDEASYLDKRTLELIHQQTINCKIIFIGDPAQLTMRGSKAVVFNQGYETSKLTENVRTADGCEDITELATKFREVVNGKPWFSFLPNNKSILHVDQNTFDKMIHEEIQDGYTADKLKVLSWTNKTSVAYNNFIREKNYGTSQMTEGDTVICNSFISGLSGDVIKTDEVVTIIKATPSIEFEIEGQEITLKNRGIFFLPNDFKDIKRITNKFRKEEKWIMLKHITKSWIDLRYGYASTINKAQGSTYKTVFIDLNDLKRCNVGDNLARLLYVAVSRASHKVVFTGDLK